MMFQQTRLLRRRPAITRLEARSRPTSHHMDPSDPPGHGNIGDWCSRAGWGQIVLAANRNGGMLRLIASRHDDDDDELTKYIQNCGPRYWLMLKFYYLINHWHSQHTHTQLYWVRGWVSTRVTESVFTWYMLLYSSRLSCRHRRQNDKQHSSPTYYSILRLQPYVNNHACIIVKPYIRLDVLPWGLITHILTSYDFS